MILTIGIRTRERKYSKKEDYLEIRISIKERDVAPKIKDVKDFLEWEQNVKMGLGKQ